MHLALLPALIIALVTGGLGGTLSPSISVQDGAHNANTTYSLYSLAAQAASPTAQATGTVQTTGTAQATATPAGTSTIAESTATSAIVEGSPTAPQEDSTPTSVPEGTETSPGAIVTATATFTGTQTIPPPVETAVPQTSLYGNFLDPAFLFSAPPPDIPMGPLAWAYFAVMLGLLGASIYVYMIRRPGWKGTNTVHYRAANTWGQAGLWMGGLGLIFLLFRVIRLDFFNLRFWLYLWMLIALVAAGWFFYWYRTTYPKEMAKYRKVQRARQYMPGTMAKASVRQPTKTSTKITTPPKPTPVKERPAQPPATSTSSQPASQKSGGGKRKKRK
jgi:hypothetical protein